MATSTLQDLTKQELYDRAQEAGIEGRSKMGKDELVAALTGQDGGGRSADADRPTTSNRSVWRGAVTFGLITIPIGLYTAIEDRDISFHLLTADTHARVRYKRVAEDTGEEVDWDDVVKGYEYERGSYVVFTKEELEQIPSDSLRAVDVVQFVDAAELDPIYFDRSYYAAPEKTAVKAYVLFIRALEESGRIGVGKVTIRDKERPCVLRPREGVLVIETMNWPDEIRIPVFDQLDSTPTVSAKELEMAKMLIDQLTERFDPARFHDTYRERLEEAIAAKVEGNDVSLAAAGPAPAKVTDLLEALRSSVEATKERRTA